VKISWKPAGDAWSGSLQLELPGYEERLDMVGRLRGFAAVDVEVDGASDDLISSGDLEKAKSVFRVLKERVSDVALTHVESGTLVTNLDDLGCFEEGVEIVKSLQGFIFGGMRLGNG
jgi:hypothetical protein